ncbi:hypothetical protein ACFVWF_28360 [Rhodococcus qingshengii]|uniref:hypothetical protein n=1 Tax=Rhodococcus qingshengii TaxID=334542 RepID=UPI0036D94792
MSDDIQIPAHRARFTVPNALIPSDPIVLHSMLGQPRVVLLKPLITSLLIEVGEYSYCDPDGPTAPETRNMLYRISFENLIIGKFCQRCQVIWDAAVFGPSKASPGVVGQAAFSVT